MNRLVQLLNRNCVLSAERTNVLLQLPRLINTTTVCSSKVNDISRKLGIPLRPKKPLPGYLRFMKEIQPSIKSSVKSPREIPVVVAARWKALGDSEKAKYHEQFEKEKPAYEKQMAAYNQLLTKDQKLAIKDERIRRKELKERRVLNLERKARLTELGKPKKPLNSYMLFVQEERKHNGGLAKDFKTKYEALSDSQKDAYKQKAATAFAQYKKAIEDWEKKMISKGFSDLISKANTAKPK